MTLAPPDLAVVAAYLAGMTLFGVGFTRSQKDLRTDFVGDRNVGWVMILVSIVATETSAVTFLSVPGVAFNPKGGNLTFLQLAFGYVVGRTVVAWLFLPQYMSGDLFSAYEVLRARFGPGVQRVASGLFLATRTVADGLRLYLMALLLQYVDLGRFVGVEWGVGPAIVVVGVVTIAYTYLGGMKAVIWTDLIQFVVKVAGAALAGVFVLKLLPRRVGPVRERRRGGGEVQADRAGVRPDGGVQPLGRRRGRGGVLDAQSRGGPDDGAALPLRLFLLVGVGMFVLMQSGLFEEAVGRRTDEVFGLFIITRLPTGVAGLLAAAAMSPLSSLDSSANAVMTDFYRPLRPHHPEGWYVLVSRLTTAGWGVAQMGVALAAYRQAEGKSVVEHMMTVAGFTTGLLLGLFLLGSLKRPPRSGPALAGLVG